MGYTNTKKFIHCTHPVFILVKSDTLSLLESPLGLMCHFFCPSYTRIICFLDFELLEGKNYVLFSLAPLHPNLIPGTNVFWIRLKWWFSGLIGKVGWGQGPSLYPWVVSFLGVEGPVTGWVPWSRDHPDRCIQSGSRTSVWEIMCTVPCKCHSTAQDHYHWWLAL